jgi:hypothetical protein
MPTFFFFALKKEHYYISHSIGRRIKLALFNKKRDIPRCHEVTTPPVTESIRVFRAKNTVKPTITVLRENTSFFGSRLRPLSQFLFLRMTF